MARPDAEVTSGFGFSLGFVSWVEANGWGALAFQAHVGVGGQSKTYSEVFQVIFAREAGWERPVLLRNVEGYWATTSERESKRTSRVTSSSVWPQTQSLTAPRGERFQSHRIGDPAQAG